MSVSDPYWLLWWATVGAACAGRSLTLGAADLAAFYLGHIPSDLGWISPVSLVVASGRKAMRRGVYRGLIPLCAGGMALLRGYFIWSGGPP